MGSVKNDTNMYCICGIFYLIQPIMRQPLPEVHAVYKANKTHISMEETPTLEEFMKEQTVGR